MFCRLLLLFFLLIKGFSINAQSDTSWPQMSKIQNILYTLASDNLKGRENYSIELFQAARFISEKFDSLGLLPYGGKDSYLLPHSEKKKKKKDTSSAINPERVLFNVCGLLPGKSKPSEVII